jgi:hypothetical protein
MEEVEEGGATRQAGALVEGIAAPQAAAPSVGGVLTEERALAEREAHVANCSHTDETDSNPCTSKY